MNIKERIAQMNSPIEGEKYITLTLTANEEGQVQWSTQSQFFGYNDKKPRRELRIPSEVEPKKMASLWSDIGFPYVFVNNKNDWSIFLLIGGNAIVSKKIVELKYPEIFSPIEVFADGLTGTIEAFKVVKDELRKVPTPKNRMKILKRDDYRCKICGRRAEDHIDVELHVHHARPFSKGGLTKENNLITLCQTCHKGLYPHFDFQLFELIPNCTKFPKFANMQTDLIEGIKRYRCITLKLFNKR